MSRGGPSAIFVPSFRTITSSLKIIRERGGDIKILNPAGRILKLFELTRLNKILDILQEEQGLKERFQLPTP